MVIPFIIDLYSAIYSLPIKVFKFVSILVNSKISLSKSFFFEKKKMAPSLLIKKTLFLV